MTSYEKADARVYDMYRYGVDGIKWIHNDLNDQFDAMVRPVKKLKIKNPPTDAIAFKYIFYFVESPSMKKVYFC